MKKSGLICMIILAVGVMSSCVSKEKKKEIKSFNLTVYLTKKVVASEDEKLPAALDSLYLPYIPDSCQEVAYLPKVKLERYGLSKVAGIEIKTDIKNWKTFFQKFYGNVSTSIIRGNIIDILNKYKPDKALYSDNLKTFDEARTLRSLTDSLPGTLCLVYNSADTLSNYENDYNDKIIVFSTVDSIRNYLSDCFCRNPYLLKSRIYIIYEPGYLNFIISEMTDIDRTSNNNDGILYLENGKSYKGELFDGKPDGWGRMTYKNGGIVSRYDLKKQTVEPNEYIEGLWRNGELQNGKLYDVNDRFISTITVGGE